MTIAPQIIKYFFVTFCSIYIFVKALNLPFTRRAYFLSAIFSIAVSPIIFFVQTMLPLYTILTIALFVMAYCYLSFKKPFSQTLCISLLSIGGSYILFTLAMLVFFPITYILFFISIPNQTILILVLVGILQNSFALLLFRTKRFYNGIPYITNTFSNSAVIFISILLLLFSSSFFINDCYNIVFDQLIISFILALSIIFWLCLQKSIHADYIYKTHMQRIDLLEDTLREKDVELERLSKIIHKDNKLLAALEHSTRELLTNSSDEKAQSLLQELRRFSKERTDTLSAYEEKPIPFPETGLFSIDIMLRYLYQQAQKHRIDFQVQTDCDIYSIINVISEQDLCTLIADLGENAIIATKDSETKNILLSLEKRMQTYILCIYDSGEPFSKEVLENLGQRRYTTHAETGGSGIGLMTTSELTKKYKADFCISDCELHSPYTKQVSITLNAATSQPNM